jgi:hypothetical protein
VNRNTCPKCRHMMRALAKDYRTIGAKAILRTAEAYRDECYHRPVLEEMAIIAAQLTHARAVADLYDDGGTR